VTFGSVRARTAAADSVAKNCTLASDVPRLRCARLRRHHPGHDRSPDPLSPIDLRLRLIALALEPGLTLARLSALPLDDLQVLVATGYFRQWRARGLSLRGIARVLHRSLRTVATLSRKAGGDAALLPAGERITVRRKLAARVAARGPIGRSALAASVRGVRRAEVEAEIAQLIDEGVFAQRHGRVALATQFLDLVGEDVERRLDSLRHFLEAVTHVIYQRLVAADARAVAMARVLTFRAGPADAAALRDDQYAALRDAVVAADARAATTRARSRSRIASARRRAALPGRPAATTSQRTRHGRSRSSRAILR
jgi:hypothetical protein